MALQRDEIVEEICDVVGKSQNAAAISGALLSARVVKYLNLGQKRIARFYNFHELNKYNENAATITDIKRYPMGNGTNNLGLTRVKDIYSIRLIDDAYSRVITRWSPRKFDRIYPYPAKYSTDRPSIYIRWGNDLEFFKIPSGAYTLYIRYSQWAQDLTLGTQVSDYLNKDQLLITTGIFETYLALEEYEDAKIYYAKLLGELKDAVKVEGDVDWEPEAEESGRYGYYESGSPWTDPFGGAMDPLSGY